MFLSFSDYDYDNNDKRDTPVNFPCTKEGFHEDPNDCTIFYRCVDWGDGRDMTPFKFDCGPGTVFSKSRGNICTYPSDSGRSECGDSENSIDSSGNQNQNPGQGQHPGQSQHPDQGQNQSPGQGQHPGQGQNQSPGQNQISGSGMPECTTEGWLEDPDDCMRYYRCVDEGNGSLRRYAFTCAAGTVWDQDLLTCNHPSDVNRPQCRQGASGGQGSNQPSDDGSGSGYPGQGSGSPDGSYPPDSQSGVAPGGLPGSSGMGPEDPNAGFPNQMPDTSDQGFPPQSPDNTDQNEVPTGNEPSGSLQPPNRPQEQGILKYSIFFT